MTEQSVSFFSSFKVLLRSSNAYFLRELTLRYRRRNIGYVWSIIKPLSLLLIVTSIRAIRGGGEQYGISMIPFFLTGYSVSYFWAEIVKDGIKVVKSNSGFLFHRNVSALSLHGGSFLFHFFSTTSALILSISLFYFFKLLEIPQDLLTLLLAWTYAALFGLGLATTLGSICLFYPNLMQIFNRAISVLFIASGLFYLVDWLNPVYQKYILVLPTIHITELFREAYFGGNSINFYFDHQYIIFTCVALNFLGMLLMRKIKRIRKID